MSLENRNDEPQTVEVENENYQRAALVTPVYSTILIAFLGLVFLCQLYADVTLSAEGGYSNFSILLAGFDKRLFYEGQYWRILTGAALHGGLIHLFFNCFALLALGRLIETISNRAHLAIVFLLSAIGGGILSLIFLPNDPSVGASGGIIGLLGYLAVYGFKRRKLMPEGFLKRLLMDVGFIALTGVLINQFSSQIQIDNFGHLGGFLVGAFYGFAQITPDLYKDPRVIGSVVKFLGVASLGIFILTAVFAMLVLLGIVQIPFPADFINELLNNAPR